MPTTEQWKAAFEVFLMAAVAGVALYLFDAYVLPRI
jgi:hypothetical protein